MNTQDVVFTIDNAIATITLNRAARLNALTLEMLDAIDQALSQIERDPKIRMLLLDSSSPRFFCAGADVNEWGEIDPEKMGSQFIRAGNRVFRRLAELDIPTVCVLSGSALGGGLELALSCDLRYAASSATVGFPEAAVGAIPGWMGCQRLIDLVGPARARELVLTGVAISAERAEQWGIVNATVEPSMLESHVRGVCDVLISRSVVSLSVGKRLLRIAESGDIQLSHEFAASVCKATPDALEGVSAFREKRPAKFS
jgi:enoyl-CoA hydratase